MAEWVDLLDSANQKYDNNNSGLAADNVQAAIDEIAGAGGGGEANTAANVGIGQGEVWRDKTGVTLNFKRLSQGNLITLTNNADNVVIGSSAIDASGVTYENLDANGDVGPGVGQLEPGLDNPAQDGYILSSTAAGVRSWVTPGAPDLSNAEFPDSAHFANEIAAVSAVDFNAGNKQLISGSAGNITLAAPGVGSYMLFVADSGTVTGIADSGAGTVTWVGPVPDWANGKLVAIACYRTGAGNWILNGSMEE